MPDITKANKLINQLVMAVLADAIDNVLSYVVPGQINMVTIGELPPKGIHNTQTYSIGW